MAPFDSFKKLLIEQLIKVDPKKILEWGPGRSTGLMVTHSEATIYSVEHDLHWYDVAKKEFKDEPRVSLYLRQTRDSYVNDPIYWAEFGKYELVFVDGLCDWRVACLMTAYKVVSDEGVVILHDSERIKYNPGRVLLETVEESEGTAVMVKKQ